MVTCPICHKQFKALPSHLRHMHKIAVKEFRKMYPLVPLVSTESRSKTSASCKEAGCGSWRRGQVMSEKGRRNLSEAMRGEKNPFYGRRHSQETRIKMSENHADFTGVRNPLRKALERDPGLKERLSKAQRAKWKDIKADPVRWKHFIETNSASVALAYLEGRLKGYGRGHKQGDYIDPNTGEKFYYRSSYELRFLEICSDREWFVAPCDFSIPYKDGEGITRQYIPDFLLECDFIVEVKPESMMRHGRNPLKFRAGTSFCMHEGLTFLVVGEAWLNNPPETLYEL